MCKILQGHSCGRDTANTLDRTLFGGPSQPEPLDERGGIRRAQLLAQQDPSVLNANQYENDAVSVIDLKSRQSCLTRMHVELAVTR